MTRHLDDILTSLQRHRDELRRRGIAHAAVFGSVARGEDRPDSDIDILITLDPAADVGLFEYVRIGRYIEEIVGAPVDMIDSTTLAPAVRQSIEHTAVHAF
jgi:predicted nucleotidyltransferase